MSQMKHSWAHTSHRCPANRFTGIKQRWKSPDPRLTTVLPAGLWGSRRQRALPTPSSRRPRSLYTSPRRQEKADLGRWAFSSSICRGKPLPNTTSVFSSVRQSTELDKRRLIGNEGFWPPPDRLSVTEMPDVGWQGACGRRELLLRASLKMRRPHLHDHGGYSLEVAVTWQHLPTAQPRICHKPEPSSALHKDFYILYLLASCCSQTNYQLCPSQRTL